MPKSPLLKAQGQDLAEVVERAGFDRADFELGTRPWEYCDDPNAYYRHYTDAAPTLLHKATDFYFMFFEVPLDERERINHGADFRAQWSPGDVTHEAFEEGLYWAGVTDAVERWLANIKNELTGPDVWAELAQAEVEKIERGGELFTEAELHQIDNRLDALLDYAAANYELTAEGTARLEAEITYLKDAARRMPRLDWGECRARIRDGLVVGGSCTAGAILGAVPPHGADHP